MLAPSQTVQDLQRARNLIADPDKWTGDCFKLGTHFCAVTEDLHARGIRSEPHSSENWNMTSPWLIMAATELFPGVIAGSDTRWERVWRVNDALGHAAVMRMYDRAIQLAMAGDTLSP